MLNAFKELRTWLDINNLSDVEVIIQPKTDAQAEKIAIQLGKDHEERCVLTAELPLKFCAGDLFGIRFSINGGA